MLALLCILPVSLSVVVSNGDTPEWGGFRGNNGCGVATAKRLPDSLGEENIAWRTELPAGYSSPTIAGERLFLTGAADTKLSTLCLSRETGELLWKQELDFDGKRPGQNSPAAPSPVTDGERVYALFHALGMVCYDVAGKELWRNPIGSFDIPHGMSTSPLLHDDLVIVLVDQDQDSYLLALDKATGKERWKTKRPGVTHTYSTPAIWEPAEGPAQVVVSGSFEIAGYSVEDGSKTWWIGGSSWQTKAVPVISGDTCFVNAYMPASTEFGVPKVGGTFEEALDERDEDGDGKISRAEWPGDGIQMLWFLIDLDSDDMLDATDFAHLQATGTALGGLFGIRLGGQGDVSASNILWKYDSRRGLSDVTTPVLAGGALFVIREGGLLTAFDPATGEIAKQERIGESDNYYASPIAGDGKLFTASQNGLLGVVTAQADFEVLSVHDLGEIVWSTPAIAGGQVFVRTQAALYCFEDLSEG